MIGDVLFGSRDRRRGEMSAYPLYRPDGSGFASDCNHCYEILQQNGDRVFYACEHCGATKVETVEEEKGDTA